MVSATPRRAQRGSDYPCSFITKVNSSCDLQYRGLVRLALARPISFLHDCVSRRLGMTIRYADGRLYEAVLLSRTDNTLRVAAKNTDDVQMFTDIGGTWVSEDCEPVRIDRSGERRLGKEG